MKSRISTVTSSIDTGEQDAMLPEFGGPLDWTQFSDSKSKMQGIRFLVGRCDTTNILL